MPDVTWVRKDGFTVILFRKVSLVLHAAEMKTITIKRNIMVRKHFERCLTIHYHSSFTPRWLSSVFSFAARLMGYIVLKNKECHAHVFLRAKRVTWQGVCVIRSSHLRVVFTLKEIHLQQNRIHGDIYWSHWINTVLLIRWQRQPWPYLICVILIFVLMGWKKGKPVQDMFYSLIPSRIKEVT